MGRRPATVQIISKYYQNSHPHTHVNILRFKDINISRVDEFVIYNFRADIVSNIKQGSNSPKIIIK
jgi:hypothetical protein